MAHRPADALGALDLFAPLTAIERESLAARAVPKRYERGDVLFLEGQPCEGLWVLASGAANVVKTSPLGRQLVIATQRGICVVAEVPVFDGGPYPASVIATEETMAFLLWKRDLLALCESNPKLALSFLEAFGRRLRHLVALAERVTFGGVRQRLAAELVAQTELSGAAQFLLAESQEQLAVKLGTVREVISRNLGRFQSEGLIRLERREVFILNAAGLKTEAESEF